jgi:glycosyltransferase involved in cell wall biosynthesis
MNKIPVSLIITTYNRKDALQKVLETVMEQSVLPNEVIIADDGSTSDTRQLIDEFRKHTNLPVLHCWQEDQGFRAAMSRNKAIAMARSPYIVTIDGDILLHRHFIADHTDVALPNRFVAGKRCMMGPLLTERYLDGSVERLHFFSSGIINRKNTVHSTWLSALFSGKVTGLKGIKTCNLGFWKSDLLEVNGFNEEFIGWGREDSDLAIRLIHAGKECFSLRFRAIAYHLYHEEYSRKQLDRNDTLLNDAICQNQTWCKKGIDQYLRTEIDS